MACSIRWLPALVLLAPLAGGCREEGAASAPTPASVVGRDSSWRMLSADAPAPKTSPRPAGYVEARRLRLSDGREGTVYMVYDELERPCGHVTEKGEAVHYGAVAAARDRRLDPAPVLFQMGRMLGVKGELHVYDFRGRASPLP